MCRNKIAMVVMEVRRWIMRSMRPSDRSRSSGIKGRKVRCKSRSIKKKIRRRNNVIIGMIRVRMNLIMMNQIWKFIRWNNNIN